MAERDFNILYTNDGVYGEQHTLKKQNEALLYLIDFYLRRRLGREEDPFTSYELVLSTDPFKAREELAGMLSAGSTSGEKYVHCLVYKDGACYLAVLKDDLLTG